MATPTQKHPYFFVPFPCYSWYDSENREHIREHWIDLWDLPSPAVNYYHFILSKLDKSGNGTTLPVTDNEIAEKVDVSVRTVRRARQACEQYRLIERVLDEDLPRGTYIYRLPTAITSQGQVPFDTYEPRTNDRNLSASRGQNTPDCPRAEDKIPQTVLESDPKLSSGNSHSTPSKGTPPVASEPLAQDLRLFLDLNLDILDSIRDVLIDNYEAREGKYMSDRHKRDLGKELIEKLAALTSEFGEYEASDVLIVCEGLAKTKEYRSAWMFKMDNHGVMDDIREELEGAAGRNITQRGDTRRKTKGDVPDEVIIKWIGSMAEQKQFVEMKRDGNAFEAVMRDRTDEEKQDVRDTLSEKHEDGALDYHEIYGWNERGGKEINRTETHLRSKGIQYHNQVGGEEKNGFNSLEDLMKEVGAR